MTGDFKFPDSGIDLPALLRGTERYYIVAALTASDGSCAGAAKLLKVNRTTLVMKMQRMGIKVTTRVESCEPDPGEAA